MQSEYMKAAIEQARLALDMGEVPVGAVVVKEGEIIAAAHNLVERNKDASAHAEMLALGMAAKAVGDWRLSGCTLYVTLEPCPMCAGAIINARIKEVVLGARDPRAGALGSLLDLNSYPLGHRVEIADRVLENECLELIRRFFRENLRDRSQS